MTTTPSSSVFAGARRSYASPWPVPGRATADETAQMPNPMHMPNTDSYAKFHCST